MFFAHRVNSELIALAELLQPHNPFASGCFVRSRELLGADCWAFGVSCNDEPTTLAFGALTRGRINTGLEIVSVPSVGENSPFWQGLAAFSRKQKVTQLRIGSSYSLQADIPGIWPVTNRYKRSEFLLDLRCDDLLSAISQHHRRLIRKAQRSGVRVISSVDPADLVHLTSLHSTSMQRRLSRGERVTLGTASAEAHSFLESGCGELRLAISDSDVLAAMLILNARSGAYYHSAGSSSEGMACGASHFLIYETARTLQERGVGCLNLSGARPHETGLREFKRRFGTREVELEAAEFDLASPARRVVTNIVNGLRRLAEPLAHAAPAQ